jgi:hypothetical protein
MHTADVTVINTGHIKKSKVAVLRGSNSSSGILCGQGPLARVSGMPASLPSAICTE